MKTDLRIWLEEVDKMGGLQRIDGADWNEEIGCISALNSHKKGPVLLFDNIKGYPRGFRVATSVNVRASTLALTLNLSTRYSDAELSPVLVDKLQAWEKAAPDFPPQEVKTGPILENALSGNEVDLFRFPTPKWHQLDGGRYIGTGCAVITKDPDAEEINLGTYRIMIHDRKTVGLYIEPQKHGRRNMEKYHERGQPCPVAVSVGHHPLLLRTGALPVPPGLEYGFVGAVSGEPIAVIKEEVTGLPIPAHSELVLVGWVPLHKMRNEGPFGEWPGYYASLTRPEPIIEVERVYYRNDPIILGAPPNRPKYSDGSYVWRMMTSAKLHSDLLKMGIPDVRGVCVTEIAQQFLIIVSIKQRYHGHAKQVGLAITQHRMCVSGGRYVIVVDEDIDPNNIEDVLWAVATRADPEKNIEIIHRAPTHYVDPLVGARSKTLLNSRAIIDACRPFEWFDEFPTPITMRPELIEKVKQKWGSLLGF